MKSLQILLIEDSQTDILLFKKVLQRAGMHFDLTIANDGLSGIDVVQKYYFDCIFTDYNLPDINGVEIIKKMRAAGFQIPIIMVTSYGDESIAVEAMKAGASDYLSKKILAEEGFTVDIKNTLQAVHASDRHVSLKVHSISNQIPISNDEFEWAKNSPKDFSKNEFLKASETSTFHLKKMLQGILSGFDPKAIENNIQIHVRVHPHLPEILIGNHQVLHFILSAILDNIFVNKISNFIGIAVKILSVKNDILSLQFLIADQDLFSDANYSMTMNGHRAEMSSLSNPINQQGLNEIYQRVYDLKGEISDVSMEPTGFPFVFCMPILVPQFPNLANHSISDGENDFDFKGIHILVIEDNSINLLVADSLLTKKNGKITLANSGKDALELMKTTAFDLVLVDIQMPNMDGYQTSRLIRNQGIEIPIIALTAHTTGLDTSVLYASGIDDFITKPFRPFDLYVKLLVYHQNIFALNDDFRFTDMDFLDVLADGNLEFKNQMIRSFIDGTTSLAEELVRAGNQMEWDQVGLIAHKLKPGLSYMGISILVTTLENIYRNSKFIKDQEKLKRDVLFFKKIYEKSIKELKLLLI